MYDEETLKKMMSMFTDPLFKKSFFDFFVKMQKEGIDAARKFWSLGPEKEYFAEAAEVFEKMVDFYIVLGFVPHFKYDEALKENDKLKKEVEFLRQTLKDLQLNLFTEGGEKAQELYKSIIDKQLEMNREIAKDFFELFKSLKSSETSGTT